jgi:hypothetical protein
LVSREVIADSIETVVGCQGFDGIVAIGGCDKNMPGCIMGLARLNRPSVFVYGGTIQPGKGHTDVVSNGDGIKDNAFTASRINAFLCFVSQFVNVHITRCYHKICPAVLWAWHDLIVRVFLFMVALSSQVKVTPMLLACLKQWGNLPVMLLVRC